MVPLLGLADPQYLPPATDVIVVFVQKLTEPSFLIAVSQTMKAWVLGFGISVGSGVIIGLIIGSSTFLKRATHSTIEFLRPIPSVAMIPLAVLFFGIKLESELFLIFLAAFWPVLIQVMYGIADVDKVAEDTARSMQLGFVSRIRYLVWPTVLPYLLTGIRLAAAIALVMAITTELIIGTPGLGKSVVQAQANNQITLMFALILTSGVIGVAINGLTRVFEHQVLFWHHSVRAEIAA
jgi:ABC-type nitrate/sulfonate/bicarbonate transport system permease component